MSRDSQERQSEEVLALLALKIRLEASLTPRIRKVFKQIGVGFEVFYRELGNVVDAALYQPAVQKELYNHYQNVVDVVFNHNRKFDSAILPESLEQQLRFEFEDINRLTSINQSEFITETNNKQIGEALLATMLGGVALSREAVARQTHERIKEKFEGRVDTIALTETQDPVERTRFRIAQENAGMRADAETLDGQTVKVALKMWQSILDGRERPAHHEASGQIRLIALPFSVGGQKLMRPRDASLGASIWNLANCRCTAVYYFAFKQPTEEFNHDRA